MKFEKIRETETDQNIPLENKPGPVLNRWLKFFFN